MSDLRKELERLIEEWRGLCVYSHDRDMREASNRGYNAAADDLEAALIRERRAQPEAPRFAVGDEVRLTGGDIWIVGEPHLVNIIHRGTKALRTVPARMLEPAPDDSLDAAEKGGE